MQQRQDNWFISLLKNNPFPQLLNKVFVLTAPRVDGFLLKISGGKWALSKLLSSLPVVQVTTIGRKSSLPRTVTLVPIYDPQNERQLALIASNFGQENYPAWSFNIRANPEVEVNIEGDTYTYVARELAVGSREYDYFWELAKNLYFGYDQYQQFASHRTIPIFVLERV